MSERTSSGAGAGTDRRVRISLIIPAIDEALAMPHLATALAAQVGPPPYEIVLADGGSGDGTIEAFTREVARLEGVRANVVPCARRGRAAQMNAAAAVARGDVLLFLHADTLLPEAGLAAVARAVGDGGAAGGGFRLAFRERDPRLAVIAAWASARSRWTRIHYGDQAMFVRRDMFFRLGGFEDVPLFEDRRFAGRLRRAGNVVTLPLAVRTSARRLVRDGIGRTSLRFAWLKVRHALGADPARLAAEYRDVR